MSDDKDEDEKKNNKITYKQSKFVFQSSYNERKWLKAHGKEDYIDFKDEEILVLRKYFKSLDSDGSGSIGVEELEDPLIALGLAQNRDEVLKLIKQVDEDGSGDIEFKEFLSIMSSVQKTDKNKGGGDESEKGAIFDFFKKMSTGQFDNQMDKIVPFRLNVSMYRRRKILDISIDQIPNNESGVNTRNGFPKMPRYIEQWYLKCILISFSCLASIIGTSFNQLNMFLTHTYLLAIIVCFSFYVETRMEKNQYIDFINQIKILKGQKDLLDILIPSAIFVCQLENNQNQFYENNPNFSNIFENTRQQIDLNNTKGYSFKREEVSGINSFQNQSQFIFPSALKSTNPKYKMQQQKHVKIDYANKNSLNIFEVERSQEILEKLQYMIQEEAEQEKNPQEISFTLYSKIKQQLFTQNKNAHNIRTTMDISGQIEIMNIVEDKSTYKYGQSYFNVKYVNCFWNQQPSLLVLLVNVSQEKRNQQLQQMNTYKDRLLATVSHDLKTPLNCIISLTGQIKEMNIVSIAQNVDIIYNNSLMLLFMIKDILDYSQIMHKKLKLSSEKINLQQCIKEVFDIFQFQCSSQNIDLIQQVEDITFYNDKNRLKQIIINFVSNAIKFTKQGFVTVKAVNQDDCVRISVGDTGTGMSDEVVKKLFKEYETFDNKDKMNQQGIGLGLFICKNLVGALGPDDCIKVESTVGLGSTFTFDIYKNEKKMRKKTSTQQTNNINNRFSLGGNTQIRSQNPSMAQNRPNTSKTLQAKDGKVVNNQVEQAMDTIPQEREYDQIISTNQGEMNMSLSCGNLTSKILAQKYKSINSIQNRIYKMNKRYNIIIVDDSKYNLIALKIYLNDYKNFDVEEFIHAEKALQRIKEQEKKYDIVFTDLQMPFMDGFELTKQIRQMQNRIQQPKIVIVTADSSDFLKIKSSQYAVNDYIEKPITDKDLFRSKIMKLLE